VRSVTKLPIGWGRARYRDLTGRSRPHTVKRKIDGKRFLANEADGPDTG
jgi:hypothetical protein